MIKSLTVSEFIEKTKENLKIQLVAGERGLDRTVAIPDINRPGLALTGYLDFFAFDRVQVIGLTEINYMRQLDPEDLKERLDRVFQYEIPSNRQQTFRSQQKEILRAHGAQFHGNSQFQ